ncbi:hypothetical protein ASD13_05575 [Microbacterium sp. Root1433D1]|uniref:ABC transporter permease n=1 Tax=Microbacterium sp. Root1433D1 TaxID=1736463 RepID=UPI0007020BCC|nr:ABC transporter permease [Microbacterium sp. Root1433D1]KQY78122.1 hypothetical protein ASD13_05575 [Microbacterium sp. Root1433D1]
MASTVVVKVVSPRAAPRTAQRLAVVVGAQVAFAIIAPLFTMVDARKQDLFTGISGPSASHILGTDSLGRDIFAQLLAGGQTLVVGAFLIALGAMLAGSLVGLLAASSPGWLGSGLMRLIDAIYAVPALLVAIVLTGVTGGGFGMAVAMMAILFIPYDARLVRAATLVELQKPYVDAASQLGLRKWKLLFFELWPNVRGLEISNACVNFAYALVTLSALSFLGIGLPADAIDWGLTLANSVSYLTINPWAALAPGLAIVSIATTVALLGDASQEYFTAKGRSL